MIDVKYPNIYVPVEEFQRDGNAGALMGCVVDALRQARSDGDLTPEEARQAIHDFRKEAMSGDYDHLIQTCMKWVNIE